MEVLQNPRYLIVLVLGKSPRWTLVVASDRSPLIPWWRLMSLLRLLLLSRGSSESSVFASPCPRKAAGKFFFIRQLASMLLLVVQGLLHGGVRDVGVVDDPASWWTSWFVQSQVWMLTDFLVEFSLKRKLFWWVESQHLALNSREFYGLEWQLTVL